MEQLDSTLAQWGPAPTARSRRLVLIVDDSPEDREAIRRYLKKDKEVDYQFLERSAGLDGLEACRESGADCLLLDYDLPDLNGLQFLDRLTDGTGDPPLPVVMLTGRGGESVAVEALKRGAQDYLVKGSYSPEGLRKTVEDAIERVAIRREVARQRRELERLYEEARESDRRKDEFLAMLAHELRNPLAPILNAVQVLKFRGDDRPTLDRMCGMIDQQLHHLCRLVDDLLDVSRITRGKIHLRTEVVDLGFMVDRAVENSRAEIEARRQSLTLRVPDRPVRIEADPTRVDQVVLNLLSNASKYTDPGGAIAVAVALDGEEVAVSVEDNGIGIAPEMLPRVFDLFTQVDGSLDRSRGGLGIGLTLVKRLVEMHGGRVEARSGGLGRGSTFTVRFPVAWAAAEVESARPPGPDPARVGPLRILIVDDNVHAAESLAIVVQLWNHDAQVANSGLDALAIADEYRPDLVLLDIGLPGMDGYSVARSLKSRPGFADVRLVAMTGYGREEDLRRSELEGFDRHLVKPIDFDVLESILQQISKSK